jgi:molybdopterin adenylyltransferase
MSHHQDQPFRPAKTAVVTISDTRTAETDKSGDLIVERLNTAGHQIVYRTIIPDTLALIRETVAQRLAARDCAFIILTGGTGLAPRDVTPEAIEPLFTKSIPGFGELFRHLSLADVGTATIQSRAVAGLCDHAVVFALPGSTGACRLAMDQIILPQLDNRHKPCNFRTVVADL